MSMSSVATSRCFARPPGRVCQTRSVVQRRPFVIRAAEANRTRDQDTVGDLKKAEVDKGISIQLERSKTKKSEAEEVAAEVAPVETPQESQPVAEAEEPSEVVAVQPKLSAEARANRDAEEAARSQTVLADTRDRTGMLDTSAQSAALNRQIGAAAGNEGKAEAVSAEKPAAADAEDESVKSKYEPSEMYDDGSFLYTAAMLEASKSQTSKSPSSPEG